MNIEKLLKEAYLNGFEDAKITDKVKGLKFDYNGMAEHYAQTKVKNLDIPRVSNNEVAVCFWKPTEKWQRPPCKTNKIKCRHCDFGQTEC